jgi:hypothetical protein
MERTDFMQWILYGLIAVIVLSVIFTDEIKTIIATPSLDGFWEQCDSLFKDCKSRLGGTEKADANEEPQPQYKQVSAEEPRQSKGGTIRIYSESSEIHSVIDGSNSLLASAGSNLTMAYTDRSFGSDFEVQFVDSLPGRDAECEIERGLIRMRRGAPHQSKVLLHELCHGAGLAHEEIWGSVMWPGNYADQQLLSHHLNALERLPGITPPGHVLAGVRYAVNAGTDNGLGMSDPNKQTTVSCR